MHIVPKGLRTWFVIHFAADYLAALPLMIHPQKFLDMLGWQAFDPVAARIIAAAFLAIGGTSFILRQASLEVYRALLLLKLIWSSMALLGILLATGGNMSWGQGLVFVIFFVFGSVWAYYYCKTRPLGSEMS